MYTKELVKKVSERVGISESSCKSVIESFRDVVKETIADGESVSIYGLGTLSLKKRNSTTRFNPAKMKLQQYPQRYYAKFNSSRSFKEFINK